MSDHKHKCQKDGCDTVWEHDEDFIVQPKRAHHCPTCGTEQYYKFGGTQPATVRHGERPKVTATTYKKLICPVCKKSKSARAQVCMVCYQVYLLQRGDKTEPLRLERLQGYRKMLEAFGATDLLW